MPNALQLLKNTAAAHLTMRGHEVGTWFDAGCSASFASCAHCNRLVWVDVYAGENGFNGEAVRLGCQRSEVAPGPCL